MEIDQDKIGYSHTSLYDDRLEIVSYHRRVIADFLVLVAVLQHLPERVGRLVQQCPGYDTRAAAREGLLERSIQAVAENLGIAQLALANQHRKDYVDVALAKLGLARATEQSPREGADAVGAAPGRQQVVEILLDYAAGRRAIFVDQSENFLHESRVEICSIEINPRIRNIGPVHVLITAELKIMIELPLSTVIRNRVNNAEL